MDCAELLIRLQHVIDLAFTGERPVLDLLDKARGIEEKRLGDGVDVV